METYEIVIKMAGNFSIGSGFGIARLVDQATVRNEKGIAIIPGSTVKGRLRSMCKRLALSLGDRYQKWPTESGNDERKICQSTGEVDNTAAMCKDPDKLCVICSIFGSPLFPSPYRFSDFVLKMGELDAIRMRNNFRLMNPAADGEWLTRMQKNRYFGRAEEKSLFCIEHVPARNTTFTGKIFGPKLSQIQENLLNDGLKMLTHLGGGRSRGLGQITPDDIRITKI